jgi:hypothetical protein
MAASCIDLVVLKGSRAELVLEFGVHFPNTVGTPLPADYAPDRRIVIPMGMASHLADNLRAILQQHVENK